MISWQARSTKFIAELRKRRQSFARGRISATLKVPPELRWWYWLEWGTQGPYPIDPHKPPYALRWFDEAGNQVVRQHVDHPGIRPRAFVRKALPDIRKATIGAVYAALSEEFRYSTIKEKFISEALPKVKEIVADSLAQETKSEPRVDPGAKLPRKTAAEAFREKSFIEVK